MRFKPGFNLAVLLFLQLTIVSCSSDPSTPEKVDNTPTSGYLSVFFEEGLEKHIRNQAYTFEAIYYKARLRLVPTTENRAIQALYNDSCESIAITRLLNNKEQQAFASKKYAPNYSLVSKTALALVCNSKLPLLKLRYSEVQSLLTQSNSISDSLGNPLTLTLLIDKSGSAVHNYLMDSVTGGKPLPTYVSALNSGTEAIQYVASHEKAVAFVDYALLSDVDDSLRKAVNSSVRFLAIGAKTHNGRFEQPHQSSIKLNSYPFVRNIYLLRKTGDFTLAKGFESFVAGPKGQIIFLKQGLMPSRQQERSIEVNFEPLDVNRGQ